MQQYIDLTIDFANRNDRINGITLDRVTTRSYDTAIKFRIEIIGHALDDTYDVKILTKYHKSGLSVMTTLGDRLEIVDGKLIYTPKVNLITEADYVRNYLYLSKDGLGLDMAQFNYQVDVSQIGEAVVEAKQVYDESYEALIAEFEQELEDYKLTLPQADSVRAEIDVILSQFGVDSQKAIGDLGEVSATVEIAEASRAEKESERVQAEQARKEAETLREESYEQKVDTAIVEADVVEKVDNKVTELTPKINQLTAQLAQTPTNQELYSNLPTPGSVTVSATNSTLSNGFITFIDDDGFSQYYTTLAPMLESRGYLGVTAVISGTMNTAGRMTTNQLRELQEKGHEIASHTHDHLPFGTLNSQQVEFQCRTAKELLTAEGLLVDSIIYPYGQIGDDENKRMIKKYYRAGATAGDLGNKSQNKLLKDEFTIKRVEADTATLAHLKITVDECIANKTWLMFMLHANTHNAERTAIIGQLLDYIKTKGVQVGTMREGLDIFGNTFSVGSKEYIKVLSDGSVYSNSIGTVFRHPDDGYDIDENTPLYRFEANKITYSFIRTSNGITMPSPVNEGVLTTYHLGFLGAGSSYQTWVQYNGEAVYKRRWNGTFTTGQWGEWRTDTFSVIIPQTGFGPYETKVLDVDISKAGGGLTNQTPIVATCRNAVIDNFSYNIRIASPTTAKLRITNLTDNPSGNQLVLYASDWDIRVFRK